MNTINNRGTHRRFVRGTIVCLTRVWQQLFPSLPSLDGKIYNGTYWAKSTFCGVETKRMFIRIHTRSSAPKMFGKFGWQTRTFCHKRWKKRLPNSSQTDYRLTPWHLTIFFYLRKLLNSVLARLKPRPGLYATLTITSLIIFYIHVKL